MLSPEDEERMDAALGRMTREYAFLDSCLRGLLHCLHLFAGGSPSAGSVHSPKHFGDLVKAIRRIPGLPADISAELAVALKQVEQLHDKRVRLSHDQIQPGIGDAGFMIAEWHPEIGLYRAQPITIESVYQDAAEMRSAGLRVAEIGAQIRNDPTSLWVVGPDHAEAP
jgi:hypothetical protein